MKLSKASLAIELSRLKRFEEGEIKLEQYSTDSEIAASVLWNALLIGDIKCKTIADLGAGTGILGIGAMLVGAKKVFLVEKEEEALRMAKENAGGMKNISIISCDIGNFKENVETVIMNPPFGTKKEHADKVFLEKAFSIAKVIYSIHKSSTKRFIEAITKDNCFRITHEWKLTFPIKRSYRFHTKPKVNIKVSCFRMEK
ncbi:methyltransferase [Candidatus Woesearchaeota archaeon]|nr:methyltransferase [Candidatus Woesearchaeota archaeon]